MSTGYTRQVLEVIRIGHEAHFQVYLWAGVPVDLDLGEGFRLVHYAASQGQAGIIRILLTHRAHPNSVTKEGATPLYVAAQVGHVEVVKALLVDRRTDPSIPTNYGVAPVHIAAQIGHVTVVKALLADRRTDSSAVTTEGATSLHVAARNGRVEVIKALLGDRRTDPSILATRGTALHVAALNGHVTVVEALLADGRIDPNSVTEEGETPLHTAAHTGKVTVVEALLADRRTDSNAVTDEGATPLHIAAQNGRVEVIKALLGDSRTDPSILALEDRTALYTAAQHGHVTVVEALVADGRTDPNSVTDEGATPLYVAAEDGHAEVVKALLVDRRTDPSILAKKRGTALHVAALVGHVTVVEALLADGRTNPNWIVDEGVTPLHIAVHVEVVKALLGDSRTDPSILALEDQTALYTAAQRGHVTVVEALLADGRIDPNSVTRIGVTPLHVAAAKNDIRIIEVLLADSRTNPNLVDRLGASALFAASMTQEIRRPVDTLGQKKALAEMVDTLRIASLLTECTDNGSHHHCLNRFRIHHKVLGAGGFGTVYQAIDRANGDRIVAAKKFSHQKTHIEKEALIFWEKNLFHLNLVNPLFVTGGVLYMEYAPGGSVRDRIKAFRLHESQVRRYLLHAIEGLNYLHTNGVLHCDIKPANMLIGEGDVLKLADFGLSKVVKVSAKDSDILHLRGTLLYMSPDYLRTGEHTVASDLWALGCSILEMVTGQKPWSGVISREKFKKETLREAILKTAQEGGYPHPIIPTVNSGYPKMSSELATLIKDMFLASYWQREKVSSEAAHITQVILEKAQSTIQEENSASIPESCEEYQEAKVQGRVVERLPLQREKDSTQERYTDVVNDSSDDPLASLANRLRGSSSEDSELFSNVQISVRRSEE